MAKLLKKHFGLGGKKSAPGAHRHDYNAQKSTSAQELTPKSPTRYQSSVSLSTSNHLESFDTHSLKSFISNDCHSSHSNHSSSSRHDHGCCRQQQQHNCCRHQCGASSNCLSPRSSSSIDTVGHSIYGISVAEESDVFDESPPDGADGAELSPQNEVCMPPVLDEYCDPVDLKKQSVIAEGADLLGLCAASQSVDDDYSVPYEVKKIMHEAKLRERFGANGSDGSASKVIDFDEPQEWLAMLSSDHLPNRNCVPNQHTPLMTPKKFPKTALPNSNGLIANMSDSVVAVNGNRFDENSLSSGAVTQQHQKPLCTLYVDNGVMDTVLSNNSPVSEVSVMCYNAHLSPDSSQLSGVSFSFSVELEPADKDMSNCQVFTHHQHPPASMNSKPKVSQSRHGGRHVSRNSDKMVQSAMEEAATGEQTAVAMNHVHTVKSVVNTDIVLEQQSWYHGSLGRIEAEELLKLQPEGTFLVRKSQSNNLDYSLSLKSPGGYLHIKIVNHSGSYILGQFSQPFESVPHMVEFFCHAKLPIRGNEQISLVYPLPHNTH